MKRDTLNKYPKAKIIKPLFTWVKCDNCKYEYRREPIYKVTDMNRFNKAEEVVYYCTNCAIDCEDAKMISKTKRDQFFESRPPRPVRIK